MSSVSREGYKDWRDAWSFHDHDVSEFQKLNDEETAISVLSQFDALDEPFQSEQEVRDYFATTKERGEETGEWGRDDFGVLMWIHAVDVNGITQRLEHEYTLTPADLMDMAETVIKNRWHMVAAREAEVGANHE